MPSARPFGGGLLRRLRSIRLHVPRLRLPRIPISTPWGRVGGGARRREPSAALLGRPPTRRRVTPVRAAALLVVLASGGAIYGAGASDAFGYRRLELSPMDWTPETDVRALIEVPEGANLFALRTASLEARISTLPTVAAVRVSVALPDTLTVSVTERTALLAWRTRGIDFLVDRTGAVFAIASPAGVVAAGLPVVVDDRAATSTGLWVGATLAAVDLDAATRLASLVPADLGSAAERLDVVVTDASGYLIRAEPDGWTAIFGFYTPELRTTELIPGQVRLLRSLLDGREELVERVILADDRNGTFVARPTPPATPAP